MAAYRFRHLRTTHELREHAAAWDALWQRSEVALPTARAALVAQWIDMLADGADFHALVVEDDKRMLAAIPLVESRLKRLLPVLRLPCNEWSASGDLLVDPACDVDGVVELLVERIVRLGSPLVWFDGVALNSCGWQAFLAAIERRRLTYERHERFAIGTIDLAQHWQAYQAAWSGNFRRQMRKMERRAEELGGVTLTVHRPTDAAEIERLLQFGFEVEDRSWKGREGTSVLKSPQLHEYLRNQALEVGRLGHLELAFLEFEGRPIAFEYGWSSKGVYFSPKVGYDEAYSHLSPGQLLRLKLVEQFFADPQRKTFDFLGPLVEATERWITGRYAIERLVVSTGKLRGNVVLRAYKDWWPAMRRARQRWQRQPVATP